MTNNEKQPHQGGRELAELLHRSGLRWITQSMHDEKQPGKKDGYCLLGQIARHAGYSNTVIDHSEESGEIPEINDECKTRAELRRVLCKDHGGTEFNLGPFLDELEHTRKELGGE